MVAKKTDRKSPPYRKATLEKRVYKALDSNGSIIPTTLEAVRRMEARLNYEEVEFPEELLEPEAVLAYGKTVLQRPLLFGTCDGPDVEMRPIRELKISLRHLTRAARNGSAISPEIEERMRTDRRRAEKNS